MSPDQILALKKQGVDPNAIVAQHAADIANEQGVDLGQAMQEARRNIQSLDAAVIAGDTAQEGTALGSPTRAEGEGLLQTHAMLDKVLNYDPAAPSAKPYRSATPDLFDINKAALAGLPNISGLAEDKLRQEALMDMPSAAIGTQDLKDLDIQARAALMNDPRVLAAEALAKPSPALDPNEAARIARRAAEAAAAEPSLAGMTSAERLAALGIDPSQINRAGFDPRYNMLKGVSDYTDMDIDALTDMMQPKAPVTATGLVTPGQPFGGGGGTYTKYANIKSVNDRAKTQNEALNNAIKNTQGNIEWLKNNTTDESFLLMSTEDQYNFLKNKADAFKASAKTIIDENKTILENNPSNKEILEAQLAKNKADRVINAYENYNMEIPDDLKTWKNYDIDAYLNNNITIKKVNNLKETKKATPSSFKGEYSYADSSILEDLNKELELIETESNNQQKNSADKIIIDKAKESKDKADLNNAITALTTTPAVTTTPATGAVTGALGTGLGGAFNEFVDPRSRADIISAIEADPYRGMSTVLAQLSANLPVTALTPQYENYLQRNVLPQMQTAFLSGGGGMAGTPTAGVEGSPFSAFEQFVRGGGGRLTSQGYQDLIGNVNTALQAQAPTERQAYLQSLYASPEAQRDLYAQGLRAGASGAVGDVIDRMVNRRYLQQQFQAPTTAFLPTALSPRTAYQTPSAIVGTGVPELDDPFMDYAQTGFGSGVQAEGII